MNTIDLSTWLQFFARLGIGLCAIGGLAFVAHWFCRSSAWRRAIWQIALVCSLLLAGIEITGAHKGLGVWLFGKPMPERVVTVKVFDPDPGFAPLQDQAPVMESVPVTSELYELPKNCWWPGLLWLSGLAFVLGRIFVAQGVFVAFRSMRRQLTDAPLLAEIKRLSGKIGLRRTVRVYELRGVSSPIAFGIARPAIGIPKGFSEQFTSAQQQAMLAHELAHLRSRDPLWYLIANLATALFWWHPGVWWMRRQLHVASEFAADEAVLLLDNGPITLAECLVTFGEQLTGSRPMNALGVGGFRSDLGKRVEALLNLKESPAAKAWQQTCAKVFVPIGLIALLVCTVGWFENREVQRERVFSSTVQSSWGNSLAALTFVAAKEERQMRSLFAEHDKLNGEFEKGNKPSSEETFRKLEQIWIPSFDVPDMTLSEAVQLLTRKTSGDVPFVINVTNPVRVTVAPMTLITLQNAIRAIVAGADRPINYAVTSKGIVSFEEHSGSKAKTVLNNFPIDLERFKNELITNGFVVSQRRMKLLGQNSFTNLWVIRPPLPEYFAGKALSISAATEILVFPDDSSLRVYGELQDVMAIKKAMQSFRIEDRALNVPQQLFTRGFKVDAEALLQRVSAAGVVAESGDARVSFQVPRAIGDFPNVQRGTDLRPIPNYSRGLGGGSSGSGLNSVTKTNAMRSNNDLIRKYFSKEGIELDPPKSLFLNDRTGELIVRASYSDLKSITALLNTFSSKPPLISELIQEAKLLFDDRKFDQAEKKLKAALEIDPDNKAAQYYLKLIEDADLQKELRKRSGKNESSLIHPTLPPRAVARVTAGTESVPEPAPNKPSSNLPVPFKADESGLHTRSFKVDLNTMAVSLDKIRSETKDSTGKTDHEVLLEFLKKTGVDMEPPKALFYNDRTGVLVIRAAQSDLNILEQIVHSLNTPVPQVTVSARFVEVTGEGEKSAGLDSLFDEGRSSITSTNAPVVTVAGMEVTNSIVESRIGILSAPQYRTLISQLENTAGCDMLSTPKVSTLSGRQAQISVVDMRTIVTGLEKVIGADGSTTHSFMTKSIPFGPVLDVIPYVSADNQSIQMTVIATVTEFMEYEKAVPDLQKVSPNATLPLPRIRARQVQTSVTVRDGQTLVLGGLTAEQSTKSNHKMPLLGSVRGVGGLLRTSTAKSETKNLFVFVTPTIINSAGRPVNKLE